ncbi:AGE family epimerase/isomerase [Okeania sp.]|uniref:AGE family epimerase/isomerase n=1 Tax=Okeania sp. TaxID=3100323 RepID=UPI002B4B2F9A|nr:AGE family epimerase/isomerase [Okeania sp.]MEB3341003.1 AGE family epimerase/isomerase [Okeania sp.]
MTIPVEFTFSDLIAGYVTKFDSTTDIFGIKTTDGREFQAKLTPTSYAKIIQNLDEAYPDATGSMRSMLQPGRYLFTYGVFYPDSPIFEAKQIVFVGAKADSYKFEKQNWWVDQVRSLANFYVKAQFGNEEIDYRNYRTTLSLSGAKSQVNFRQETDTISRMVYGMATAYMMTGEEVFLEAAEKGTDYLRDHMRFVDLDEGIVYWYHGIDVQGEREQKIFTSEFGDDYDAIPAYEQIYALAGPLQTYRLNGDPRIIDDTEKTIKLFNDFFLDKTERGGYYSHLDPITLDPLSESLGRNKGTKNWNSVGDHAPAYLINLWLATEKPEYADMLEYTFDTIEKRFPDYENCPFVNEKFFEDWSPDQTWGWQQNRAVVGHNMKIAWNLMRMNSLKSKDTYVDLAKKIAEVMPAVGSDQQRGGWYDVVERALGEGEKTHRFVWHDRKAWWQQEQSILAYYILAGTLKEEEYHRLAREAAAFYNAWFLDTEDGGVYFNVLANGIPFLASGNERGKGSHSMSGYHSTELCYLAAVYTNLLVTKQPMDFYFKPIPGGFPDNILRVSPDILPPGSIKIGSVEIDGKPYSDFDADKLFVKLPETKERVTVKVNIVPN